MTDLTVARALTTARAVVATWLHGARCPTCGERTRRMLAHAWVEHGDEATT